MKIILDSSKSLEQNASIYFEKAKKAKKKAEGARAALEETKRRLKKLDKKIEEEIKEKSKVIRKKEWYEKFRWFYTSENFLVIAGRDATTNEIVIKKHTDKDDIVFHTELPASPFGVLKGKGKISIEETAQFIACYSKAWKVGRAVADVFYVKPDQVTKKAPAGEFIAKGAFMIYGKKKFIAQVLKLYIGKMEDGKIMSGPESAVKKHCNKYTEIIQGNDKTSFIAKKIKFILNADNLDDIIRVIPQGSKLQ